MQPKGAEPWRVLPWESRHQLALPCSRTATRSRHGRCSGAGTCGDGTSLRFMLGRGGRLARLPGEHSPRLGTPGLQDESPLGFGDYARRADPEAGFDDSATQSLPSFRAGALLKVCDARQSRHGTAGLEPRISRPARMHAMLSVSGIRENPVRSVTP